MSGINGDKARFHKARKKSIARRLKQREMLEAIVGSNKAVGTVFGKKSKEKPE